MLCEQEEIPYILISLYTNKTNVDVHFVTMEDKRIERSITVNMTECDDSVSSMITGIEAAISLNKKFKQEKK